MLIKLLIPFFIFLVTYILSNHYIEYNYIKSDGDDSWKTWNMIFNILVLVFATYFLAIEGF